MIARRGWIALAWGAFTAALAVSLAATGRFMFPNVLSAAITLADDGQILVDKGRRLRHELAQWLDPEALLQV